MSTLFVWKILVKVDATFVEGPVHGSMEPVSDKVIGDEITALHKCVKLDEPADEVDELVFVAFVDGADGPYYEPLDPYVFWPNPPEIIGCEYRGIVRLTENRQERR